MKILSWNVRGRLNIRGLSAPNKRRMAKRHLEKSTSNIVRLQETKCNEAEEGSFINHCRGWSSVFQPAEGRSGKLGILWKTGSTDVSEIVKCKNWISC